MRQTRPLRDTGCERDERDGRRQGESKPCGHRTKPTGTAQPEGDAHLAACGARQEFAQRDQIRVAFVVKLFAPRNEFRMEVAEVGHRPPKEVRPSVKKAKKTSSTVPLEPMATTPSVAGDTENPGVGGCDALIAQTFSSPG